jgi:ABC-type sugar transport system ATPase subunit
LSMSVTTQGGSASAEPSAMLVVPPALEVASLVKRYPGTVALRDFDFRLEPGEVRALLGKNGAGKSTFVEILSGTVRPDGGTIRVDGRDVIIVGPVEARAQGISTVHQESQLFPDLSVRENITIGRCAHWGVISRAQQDGVALAALAQMDTHIDLDARVSRLSTRDQQLVAIAKALSFSPRVLILDEPTSALVAEDVDALLALVRRLAAQGVAVIYVSHRLDEIPRVADGVTVLRDGEHVGTVGIGEASPARIVEMMVGRSLGQAIHAASSADEAVALRAVGLQTTRHPSVDLAVHRGEIVGLWGMPGSGRSELMRAIYGLQPALGGQVEVDGDVIPAPSPERLIERGVGFSPDDRKRDGLVMALSVGENLVLASLGKVSRLGVVQAPIAQALAEEQVARLGIKVASNRSEVRELSGGNQQKVVVGKWLAAGVRVLMLDEPTKGIDVEARAALYALLRELARDGVAVLMAPTELEELFLACDRIVVLRDGQVVSDRPIAACDPASVMSLAMSGVA